MAWLIYVRLIGFTAGTLLMLFWMVVILGYRRQRNFERVFFFLCLSLFLFYGGSLLSLNAQIHYAAPPIILTALADAFLLVGLCLLPPLLVHLHLAYANVRNLISGKRTKRLLLAAFYAPSLYFGLRVFSLLATPAGVDPSAPGRVLGRTYGVWLILALATGVYWETRFGKEAPDRPQEWFHKRLGGFFIPIIAILIYLHFVQGLTAASAEITTTVLALLALIPFAVMLQMVFRFNFLQIGRQKNLVYAVSVTFLALLYLALVRKVATWLEPMMPPEATAAILVFVLVIFIEPLQRTLSKWLREAAQGVMDTVQKLTSEIQEEARHGDPERLRKFVEKRVREQLGLREVRLEFAEFAGRERRPKEGTGAESERNEPRAAIPFDPREFPIRKGAEFVGELHIEPHGAGLSGDTYAAVEFLCEQLAAAFDLCGLIEQKLRLERELAERERMAALGQMAASISHNLKNPLGSIKTILQVQLENPQLPAEIRGETRLVLEEIGRLSAKLNQLLQFSRPASDGEKTSEGCDAANVAMQVTEVLRHEAERKGLLLEVTHDGKSTTVRASKEALSDIVSNLVVNALEASPRGGRILVNVTRSGTDCVVSVDDDGPGIPQELRDKILQPFFTTKTHGTGLGLAIVARRAAEAGGRLDFASSRDGDGRGARFSVFLPSGEAKK